MESFPWLTVVPKAKYFKNYLFLAYRYLLLACGLRSLENINKNATQKIQFLWATEISLTTTHRQKFLRQGSTEISGTTVQRNFWDNDPQKFLGRLERINFWGPLMRSRLYFQFALRFQFSSANEKKKILFKTIYSSFFVICDRKQS